MNRGYYMDFDVLLYESNSDGNSDITQMFHDTICKINALKNPKTK